MKKLTIFAMTKKGETVIKSIHRKYPEMIAAVVAARDTALIEDRYDCIKEYCISNNIPFYDKNDQFAVSTTFALAVSWRWLIHADSTRLIVFHDSLLPRYRGFNPLVSALINGDETVGVTAFFATEGYDLGDIIFQSQTHISYPITISEAIDKLQANYEFLGLAIADVLYRETKFSTSPQNETNATYSLWRDEEDYFINWSATSHEIKRMLDAVGFPYKGAASILNGKIVRIMKAEVQDHDVVIVNRTPGKVIFVQDKQPVVVCGNGLLKISELRNDVGENLLPLKQFRARFKGFPV